MKKIICKVEYDTDSSELISRFSEGSFGDPDGYEECLYVTEGGKYFLYTNGGPDSRYPKANITRMSPQKAEEWKEAHK